AIDAAGRIDLLDGEIGTVAAGEPDIGRGARDRAEGADRDGIRRDPLFGRCRMRRQSYKRARQCGRAKTLSEHRFLPIFWRREAILFLVCDHVVTEYVESVQQALSTGDAHTRLEVALRGRRRWRPTISCWPKAMCSAAPAREPTCPPTCSRRSSGRRAGATARSCGARRRRRPR